MSEITINGEIRKTTGKGNNVDMVFEHPGEATFPVSSLVCKKGGMVVICAGTTGYNATVDLRYLWMRQKRLQGSHFANDEQAKGLNDLVMAEKVDPCLSRTFAPTPRYSGVISPLTVALGSHLLVRDDTQAGVSAMTWKTFWRRA